jgi:EAL domain-containing protein (putative c-di-GMP-specific phosphodiesterase class I)
LTSPCFPVNNTLLFLFLLINLISKVTELKFMRKSKNNKAWDEYLARTSVASWDAGPVVIAGEKIVPHFQPIIGLTSGQIVGYECLDRALNNTTNAKSSPRSFGHLFLILKLVLLTNLKLIAHCVSRPWSISLSIPMLAILP